MFNRISGIACVCSFLAACGGGNKSAEELIVIQPPISAPDEGSEPPAHENPDPPAAPDPVDLLRTSRNGIYAIDFLSRIGGYENGKAYRTDNLPRTGTASYTGGAILWGLPTASGNNLMAAHVNMQVDLTRESTGTRPNLLGRVTDLRDENNTLHRGTLEIAGSLNRISNPLLDGPSLHGTVTGFYSLGPTEAPLSEQVEYRGSIHGGMRDAGHTTASGTLGGRWSHGEASDRSDGYWAAEQNLN